jgi:hypothetical protein
LCSDFLIINSSFFESHSLKIFFQSQKISTSFCLQEFEIFIISLLLTTIEGNFFGFQAAFGVIIKLSTFCNKMGHQKELLYQVEPI